MSSNKEEERLARSMSRSRSKTSQGPTSPPASPTSPLLKDLVDSPVNSPLSPRGKFNINSPNPGKTSQRLSLTPEEREKIMEQRRIEDEQRETERRALAEKEKEMAFKRNSLKRSDLTNEKGSLLTQLRESLQPATSNTEKDRIEKRLSIPRVWKKPEDSSKSPEATKSPEAKSPEQSPIEPKKEVEATPAQKNQQEEQKKADDHKAAMEQKQKEDQQRQESEKKAHEDQKKRDEARRLEAIKEEEEKARKHQEDQAKEHAKRDEERHQEEMRQLEEKTRAAAVRDSESKSASTVRADPIKADFCIHYVCDFGQSVAVIGNKAPLLEAIPLQWHDGHHWKVNLTLEDKNLEYHYLVMSNGSIVREEKRQHHFHSDSTEDNWLD
eukprot:TRINITY_DN774_c0_g1_i1.p1 TRINITY_DN774_c0_g1~~TRINITY_DN774_c0_g1_i1.p1  ORF type:complete len:383 (+),score=138.63 TRINITY_DN774_c0_g1_i1:97-1245(+)